MRGTDSQEPTGPQRSSADDAALWRRFRGVAGEDVKIGAVHRLKLTGITPDGFGIHLKNFLASDERRTDALMRDVWRIGMERIELEDGVAPWRSVLPSKHFADRLHRFDWVHDLFSEGPVGADRARMFVDEWIDSFGDFNGFAWRAAPITARIWNWMRCGGALFDEGDDDVRDARMTSLIRQIKHLEALIDTTPDPAARWHGACVLVARSVCLANGKGLDEALARLEAECTAQILPDGCHVARSPSRLLSAYLDLQSIRDVLERAERPVPDFVTKWVPRMGGMLAFFQNADGALSPFNDSDEARAETVVPALDMLETPPRRFTFAPKSGFQKLEKNGLRLVLDCGEAPPEPFGDYAHAGALGFELSDGPARLITSCGNSPEVNIDWQAAVRRTGAHSTLVLSGRDSAVFNMNEESRLLSPSGPEGISAKRLEEGNEIWLDAQHSGYKTPHGLLHRRRLFMSGDGTRLTGEDSLVRPVSQGEAEDRKFVSFEIRFHLHPTVTAMMASDSIRLICDNGAVWRFKTSHEGARLERTIYLARGVVERPEQIVMAGFADPNSDGREPPNCVRWAFLRERAA